MFADVVFPLPFRNSFTYSIPEEFGDVCRVGIRVTASFGKRVLTGFVTAVKETAETADKVKSIIDILDFNPVFDEKTLAFYNWIADYYLCSLGEALKNAVPAGLEVTTKRKIVAEQEICRDLFEQEKDKSSNRAKILEFLSQNSVTSMNYLQKNIKTKNIYSILKTLEKKGIISIIDEIEKAKVRIKTVKYVTLNKDSDFVFSKISEIERKSPKQAEIILLLSSLKEKLAPLSEVLDKLACSASSVKGLADKGLVTISDVEVKREYSGILEEEKKTLTLTPQQQKVFDIIAPSVENEKFDPYLLFGVTGSGKTQVYIELTKTAINSGKGVIILVPEISLTPQMTGRFYNYFGDKVTVIHSKMSYGERYDSWRSLLKGETKIVIGARSALFAPVINPGLIIVDEEHDQSYKHNDAIPKYHARDCAVVLARMNSCPVVLGSATPSIESMYNAQNGKYRLLQLPDRIDDAQLPEIKLVNILREKKDNLVSGIFSKFLLGEIEKRMSKKEGVIILQNRRGFATQVYCEDCGEIVECSECSVSMVHHLNKNMLVCHYCGNSQDVPRACSNCGSLALKFFGTGTQRVEDELDYYFPEARIERIDSDTISKKGHLQGILNDFRKGDIDILVGTQIVSKGLDFSNVTLVGVISAETNLWMPDFRADERTFQLLTQVAGRAGRRNLKGEVIIQTQNDKNFVLQKVKEYDYENFYNNEINKRQQMLYPPFSRLCLIEFKHTDENTVRGASSDFFKLLQRAKNSLLISPPTPAVIYRIKGSYRMQILVKSLKEFDKTGSVLRKAVTESYIDFGQKSRFRNIKIYIDIDPQNII